MTVPVLLREDSFAGFPTLLGIGHALLVAMIMNTANPFQIPSCLQRADAERRRRERFKKSFIAVVAAIVLLLVGLLIEGCKTEKAAAATTMTPAAGATGWLTPQANQTSAMEQKPEAGPRLNLNAAVPASRSAPAISKENAAATASHLQTFYVVKSGDTLTRIAKAYGTTVKAIKSANGLESDRIVAGAKLKIPEA